MPDNTQPSEYEVRRDKREEAEEKRKQERHDAEMQRERELHEKKMEGNPTMEAAQMALLGSAAKLLETSTKVGDAWLVKYSFSNKDAIRAQACNLVRNAAELENTPEALKAAAETLMEMGGWVSSTKKSEAA